MVSAFSSRHWNDHASLAESSPTLRPGFSWGSARLSWGREPQLGETNPTWPGETTALLPIDKSRAWRFEARLFVDHAPFGEGIH